MDNAAKQAALACCAWFPKSYIQGAASSHSVALVDYALAVNSVAGDATHCSCRGEASLDECQLQLQNVVLRADEVEESYATEVIRAARMRERAGRIQGPLSEYDYRQRILWGPVDHRPAARIARADAESMWRKCGRRPLKTLAALNRITLARRWQALCFPEHLDFDPESPCTTSPAEPGLRHRNCQWFREDLCNRPEFMSTEDVVLPV